ncbi:hypothetical protein [Hydrogenophaga soli]
MRYLKTEEGQQAFKQRSSALSARQRSVFLLFDGQRTAAEVLKSTAALGTTPDDVTDLVTKGFLVAADTHQPPPQLPSETVPPVDLPSEPVDEGPYLSPMERYQLAYPIATRLTAGLGLRGFKLNLAIEAASGYDDLVALLPRLTEALGKQAVAELKKALNVH